MTAIPGALDSEFVVSPQFRGPPNSGNGGYVGGQLADRLGGSIVTVVLRAPIPIDVPIRTWVESGSARLHDPDGGLIAEAREGDAEDLPTPPAPPTFESATRSADRFVGLSRMFHPVCFTCATDLDEGYGLRVFVGQIEGRPPGHVAGPWRAHANFADEDGLASSPAVWAALDCPGSVAWVELGAGGGLLGTMTCEVLRRPACGELCIVTAWPIERSGRKSAAGTALFTAAGELLARSRQVWIGRAVE